MYLKHNSDFTLVARYFPAEPQQSWDTVGGASSDLWELTNQKTLGYLGGRP